jgi:hypothetical protein
MSVTNTDLDRLLDAIEQTELTSLRWGYVDGSLSEEDLEELVRGIVGNDQANSEDLIEALIDRAMVLEVRQPDGSYRLRSRFAESVRLLRDLKLLVPQRPWPSASNLVSDFRVDARPRRAPRRDVPAQEALEAFGLATSAAGFRRELAAALLGDAGHGDEGLRLSAFQVRAGQAILQSHRSSRGVVISAGTGSGKTLAFYLPALVEIGTWVEKTDHWTKAIALYPRVELLKDQFSETFRLVRKLDSVLAHAGRRAVTLGSLFSLTPRSASLEAVQQANWPEAGRVGFICPFLVCPLCGGELIWRQADLVKGVERLSCSQSPRCAGEVSGEHVVLTRERAVTRPPDIVFTTAEMVNQRLSDTRRRVVLGVHRQTNRRVRLILLDEIHTYAGTTGAQTALVLRRWQHAIGQPVRIVGLSATLRDAGGFLSQLTGLSPTRVTEVAPSEDELERLSAEYQLILRGDPVSQASLLSTSIQAAYLLARVLDAPKGYGNGRDNISDGRFGSRAFVFTDDLDVVNRLFDDLRDAEGYDLFGKPRTGRAPLAALRASAMPDPARRDSAGQLWRMCEKVGRPPTVPLRITRTSSQDAGVSTSSDIVVATSALEVGFNDPTVGGVLQHKAPREFAAFVQRKGRAGRTMQMRPWMVTVLSDYGRDRVAYQTYEQLFDPMLPPQQLPIRNQYVLRMQAVFSFIEWLADHNEEAAHPDWWWRPLNGPAGSDAHRSRQQLAVLKTVRALLRSEPALLASLSKHLALALQVSEDTVRNLLWEPPRSLLLEVLPTLDRRLATHWVIPGAAGSAARTDLNASPPAIHPLPDFVPSNLFSDLSLPEVAITIPPAYSGAEERRELMPVAQALRQLAPGRVSRRFAFERGGLSHWVPVPFEAGSYDRRISDFATQYEFVNQVVATVGGEAQELPCFRPWIIPVARVPKEIGTTSNGFLDWSSQLIPIGEGFALPVRSAQGWKAIIDRLEFFLHRFRCPITVRRFATRATATLRIAGIPHDQIVHTRFTTNEGEAAAVGFEQEVDGICLHVNLPTPATLVARASTSLEEPAWRAAYFRDRVLGDDELGSLTNRFQRDWLHQIYVSALIARANRDGSTLAEAHSALHASDAFEEFRTVMVGIFQMLLEEGAAGDDVSDAVPQHPAASGRLQQSLTELLQTPAVIRRLEALAPEMWSATSDDWGTWLWRCAHETIGEVLLLACSYIAPQHSGTETLIVDLDRGPEVGPRPELGNTAEVWITESTLGGAGVVEAIAEAVAEEPIALARALAAALAPGEQELTSGNLDRFIDLVLHDEEIAAGAAKVRGLNNHALRDEARSTLYAALARRGTSVDHSLSVALNQRLLQTGEDNASDQLIADMLSAWRAAEHRLGVAIDLRVFCYLAATDSALQARLRAFISAATGAADPTTPDVVGIVSSVLWARPAEVRSHALDGYSPFRERGFTDPAFVRELVLTEHMREIRLGEEGWLVSLQIELAGQGAVRLVAGRDAHEEDAMRAHLARILATPVNVDYLQFFPSIEQVTRTEVATAVTLILRELM